MAHKLFLNLELLALKIVDEHIEKMTESNVLDSDCPECADKDAFENNLKNGWIAIVMLVNYVESTLNTILRDCVQCDDEKLMRLNFEEKIKIPYLYYRADMSGLKSDSSWEVFLKVNRIRNELIHYKFNYIGTYGHIPVSLFGAVFTSIEFKKLRDGMLSFCKKIAKDFNLTINLDAQLFDSDGWGGPTSYIYDSRIT